MTSWVGSLADSNHWIKTAPIRLDSSGNLDRKSGCERHTLPGHRLKLSTFLRIIRHGDSVGFGPMLQQLLAGNRLLAASLTPLLLRPDCSSAVRNIKLTTASVIILSTGYSLKLFRITCRCSWSVVLVEPDINPLLSRLFYFWHPALLDRR